jgi:hypothetical protein
MPDKPIDLGINAGGPNDGPCECCQVRPIRIVIRLASGPIIRLCGPCDVRLGAWLVDQALDYPPKDAVQFMALRRLFPLAPDPPEPKDVP